MNVIRQPKRGGANAGPGGGSRPLAGSQRSKGRGRGAADFELIQYRPGERGGTSSSSSGDVRTPSNLQLQMAISSSAYRTSSSSIQTQSGNNLSTPSANGFGHLRRGHQTNSRPSSSGGSSSSFVATPRSTIMGPPKTPQNNLRTPRNSVVVSSTPRSTPTISSSGGNTHHTHVVLAVTEGRGHARGEVGIAVIDIKRPRLILCQLSDRQTYPNTLTKISVFSPAEILIPHTFVDSSQPNKLYNLLEAKFPFVSISKVQRRLFRDSEGLDKVQNLCLPENSSCQLILQEKFYALAAAAALLKYVEFVQNVIFASHSLKIEYQGAHHGTIIDVKTAKNLELLLNQHSNTGTHTLLSMMDHCCTHGGSRLLRACLLHPPCSLSTITQRQDGVEELVKNPDIAQKIREVMQQLPDVEQLLTLCMQTPSTIDSNQAMETRVNYVLMLKTAVETLPLLVVALEKTESFLLCKARKVLQDPRIDLIKARIIQTLNEDVKASKGGKTAIFQRCFAIKSGINELLDIARKTYCELINDINEHVLELGSTHSLALKMNYSATKGYHIQIPIHKSHSVKKSELPPIFVQVQESRSSLTCTTDTLIHANERIKSVTSDILNSSNKFLTVILNDIRQHISYLYEMCESIAEVDIILALAQTSRSHNYVRPKFGENLQVKSSRHPILESISTCDPTANDIMATSWQNLSIITGPNMSGKSIYIRQVLLLQIMAQVGCYVPAEEATFRITDRIFSHLNFDDSIENNASTLSLEMREMQLILSGITPTSLVALDELCRGTAVTEGTAIAWSLCEELSGSTAFVFVTTHFRGLTKLATMHPCIKNIHLETVEHEFSDKKCRLVYTHRLMPGVNPVENYGLRLAQNLDIPASILQMAEDFASQIRSTSEENLPVVQEDEEFALPFALYKLKLLVSKDNFSVDELQAVHAEMKEAVRMAELRKTNITSDKKTTPTVSQDKPLIEDQTNRSVAQKRLCDYSSSDCDSTFSPLVGRLANKAMNTSDLSESPIPDNDVLSSKSDDDDDTSSDLTLCNNLQPQSMSPSNDSMDSLHNLTFTSVPSHDLSFDRGASPSSSTSFCSQHTWLAESPMNQSTQNRSTSESLFTRHKRMLAESPLDQSIQVRKNPEVPFLSPKRSRNHSDSSDSDFDESPFPRLVRLDPSLNGSTSHISSNLCDNMSIVEENGNPCTSFSSFCVDTTHKPLNDTMGSTVTDFFSQSTVVLNQNSFPSNPFQFMNKSGSNRRLNFESLFKSTSAKEVQEEVFTPDGSKSSLNEYEESSPRVGSEVEREENSLKKSATCLPSGNNPKIIETPNTLPSAEDRGLTKPTPSRHPAPQSSLQLLMESYCSNSDSD